MVYVRLENNWTDREGATHSAGEMVDVDASTLAQLQANGMVADPGEGEDPDSWVSPTDGDGGGDEDPDSWVSPTGGGSVR